LGPCFNFLPTLSFYRFLNCLNFLNALTTKILTKGNTEVMIYLGNEKKFLIFPQQVQKILTLLYGDLTKTQSINGQVH
jgi:hypothetical protein